MSELIVNRPEIVSRCLSGECPDCGEKLPPGAPWSFPKECPHCAMTLRRSDGFFLGAWVINYGIVAFGALPAPMFAWKFGMLSGDATVACVIALGMLLPIFLYRTSWKLWLALHYGILPHQLPANAREHPEDIDD